MDRTGFEGSRPSLRRPYSLELYDHTAVHTGCHTGDSGLHPASIPAPYVLLEIIRYSSTKLTSWSGAHCNHRLRSLNTLLLTLTASNQQRVNLAAVKAVIIPVETALKLPEVPISGRKYENWLALLTSPGRSPLILCWPLLKRVLLPANLDRDATEEVTQQCHILRSPEHVRPLSLSR